MKYSKYFQLEELVNPRILERCGERCSSFLHVNAKYCLDDLREELGVITINDWAMGGQYKDSGLREPHGDVGAPFSSHRFGCGFDLKFHGTSSKEAYYHILNNQLDFPFISRMEGIDHTPSWLHIEIDTARIGDIIIFNP